MKRWILCTAVALVFAVETAPQAAAAVWADIDVVGLDPQRLVEGEDPGNWRWMPDFIRGSDIHSLNAGHPAGIEGGVISYTVTTPGTLYLAANYGYDGNSSGGWTDTRITREKLEADGWAYRSDMKAHNGRVYRLFEKDVSVGQYDLRVNKGSPPLLITGTPQTGNVPSKETPWPIFGPVTVSEFTPVELQESTTPGIGFTHVPEALRGGFIFTEKRRHDSGELEFRVQDDATVYLAGFFGYDGNSQGDWDDDRLMQSGLLELGWTHVDYMTGGNGKQLEIYSRKVSAGETYRLRVNKYTAPLLITTSIQPVLSRMEKAAKAVKTYDTSHGQRVELRLLERPIHRYHDKPRGVQEATVWAWTRAGRPLALLGLERYDSGRIIHTRVSLRTDPISFVSEDQGSWILGKSVLEWKPLPAAPKPANTKAKRLLQMTRLARRFTAYEIWKKHHKLPLLPEPVHQWFNLDVGQSDGAMFFYAHGTNPEAVGLIECRRDDSGSPVWRYGFVPLASARLFVHLDDENIWTHPDGASKPAIAAKPAEPVELRPQLHPRLPADSVLIMTFEKDTIMERSGNLITVQNMAGPFNHAAGHNAAWSPDGKVGGAAVCMDGHLRISEALRNLKSEYTVAAWVKSQRKKSR